MGQERRVRCGLVEAQGLRSGVWDSGFRGLSFGFIETK
jgi:tetrahydromethanopterin S-methyltransferase subunit F